MSRLVLVTGPDPGTLLRAAAAPFLVEGRPAEPLPIVALRQGGLRDEVHRLASEAGCAGWIGRPIVVFAELPGRLAGDRKPLDEFERRALIHAALARSAPSTLPVAARRTLVESLDRLFGDLCADDVAPETFRRALDALEGDGWERGRDRDLVSLFSGYRDLIAGLPPIAGVGRTDGRDGLAIAARAIREQPDVVRLRLRRPFDTAATPRPLHIYGLADLRGGWRMLLEALHGSDVVSEIRVHLVDAAPGAADDAEPLRAWLRERADSHVVTPAVAVDAAIAHLRRTLFAPGSPRAPRSERIRAVQAPDMTRELEHVARTVKRLLLVGATKPHEIAVVARKARPHLTRAAATFAAHGIPVHARLRHTLTEVPAVAALLRVFAVAANGWRIKELEALAASPYFAIDLDRAVMRRAVSVIQGRGLAAWRAALGDLEALVRGVGDDDEQRLPPLDDVQRTIDAFERFATVVKPLDESRTIGEWIAYTQSILRATGRDAFLGYGDRIAPEHDDAVPRELRDALRLDATAIVHLDDILAAWAASLAHEPDAARRHTAAQWAGELGDVLEDAEVTLRVGHAGGVQLLEALSAEGRAFPHVFVVGLESGAFPREATPDPFFADDERARLAAAGMPAEPSATWLAREATLFRTLVLGARESLHLSWCYADANGAPQLPSAFAEDVMARFARDDAGAPMDPATIEGSAVVAQAIDDVFSPAEALRVAASMLASGGSADAPVMELLAAAGADDTTRVAAGQMLHAATVEQVREDARRRDDAGRPERAHAWNGDLSDARSRELLAARFGDRVWSATQLEGIGRCGFSFVASRALGVRAPGDIDPDDADARDVGSARHLALSRIYPRIDVLFGGGAPDEAERTRIAPIIAQEAERAIMEQGGSWTQLAGLRRARVRELAAEIMEYICWEMEPVRGQPPRKVHATELAFGMDDGGAPPVRLQARGRTVQLRGQVDRVDTVLVEHDDRWVYAVDHKSSGGAFTGMKELQPAGAILQLALYLHVLEKLGLQANVWGGAYQLVRGHERKGALVRGSVLKKGVSIGGNATQQQHDATIRESADMAAMLVETVLAGKLPARTPGSTDCLSYCDFRDVCREERIKPKTW